MPQAMQPDLYRILSLRDPPLFKWSLFVVNLKPISCPLAIVAFVYQGLYALTGLKHAILPFMNPSSWYYSYM